MGTVDEGGDTAVDAGLYNTGQKKEGKRARGQEGKRARVEKQLEGEQPRV